MASAKKWDQYTEHLALLGRWEPTSVFGRDVAEQARQSAASNTVAAQGLQILRQVWATLPPEVRTLALDALENIGTELA